MTVDVKEIFSKSESGSIQSNGANTITRTFNVLGTTSRETALNGAWDSGSLPSIGDTVNLSGATATYSGTRSWSRPDGFQDIWVVDCEYTTAPSESTSTIDTMGATRATTKSVYRTGGFAPPDGGWDNPAPIDLGGNPVDAAGSPTSIVHTDRKFETVEKVVEFPNISAYSNLVATRNYSNYEGGATGTILYLGFSWNFDTTSGLWVLRHQFAVDEKTYHCEQVATTDAEGKVDVKKFQAAGAEDPRWVAKTVYWIQPFPLASFDALPDF